jgi:hypothetical protein
MKIAEAQSHAFLAAEMALIDDVIGRRSARRNHRRTRSCRRQPATGFQASHDP